jgi:hypothetical protein
VRGPRIAVRPAGGGESGAPAGRPTSSLTGPTWSAGGWPGVVALAGALFLVTGLLALWLRRTPSLDSLDQASRR